MGAKAKGQNLKQAAKHCKHACSICKIAGLATANIEKWMAKQNSRYSEILNFSIQGPASAFSWSDQR